METKSQVKYGQELGPNLIKIAKKLIDNKNLCRLLINTDLDPLNEETHGDINTLSLFHKNIKVIPLIAADEQTTQSKIVILYSSGEVGANLSTEALSFIITIYVPFKEWLITGDTLRPFAIMSEIRQSLQDRRINGLGEIKYDSFNLATLTEEMGCYTMRFNIYAFA